MGLQKYDFGSVVGESRHTSCIKVFLNILDPHDIAVDVLSNLHKHTDLDPKSVTMM